MNIIVYLYIVLMVDITATKQYSVSGYCRQKYWPEVGFSRDWNSASLVYYGSNENDLPNCLIRFKFFDIWRKTIPICVEASMFDDCRLTVGLRNRRIYEDTNEECYRDVYDKWVTGHVRIASQESGGYLARIDMAIGLLCVIVFQKNMTCKDALLTPWCGKGPLLLYFLPKYKDSDGDRGTISIRVYTKEDPILKTEATTHRLEYTGNDDADDDSEDEGGLSILSILGIIAATVSSCLCCCGCCIYCCKDDDDGNSDKTPDLNGQQMALTTEPDGEHTSTGGIQHTVQGGVQYTVYPMAGASGGSNTPTPGYKQPVQAVPIPGYHAPIQQSNTAGYQPVSQRLPYEAGPPAGQLFPSSGDCPVDQYAHDKHQVDSTCISASGETSECQIEEGYTMPSAPPYPTEPPPSYYPGM